MTGHKQSDEFMMYSFKVQLCPRLDHHNWKHCPHRHPGEVAAQRRHPSLHKPAFCMNLKLYGSCAAGDDCPFSHNTFEMSLHPERYKTTLCTLGDKCNREICFFAHSTEDLRTPDVTAPLGATGPETVVNLTHLSGGEACASAAADSSAAGNVGPEAMPGQTIDGMQLRQQQQELQHLLRQVEQQLQLEAPAQQQQQQQLQQARFQAAQQQQQMQDQQALLMAQAQQQQQQQQQMNDLVLAQRQMMLGNQGMAPGLINAPMGGYNPAGQVMQQRGGGMPGMQPQLLPVLMQDPSGGHRGESFTSQCSTSSYVSGLADLRAASGSLPVSPLIDRSAHSFTLADGSRPFTTLGVVPERPHSFSVGDRLMQQQQAAVLGSLSGMPSELRFMDASRPNSFTLGHPSPNPSFTVERSSASYSVLDSGTGLGLVDGGLSVVERSANTQRSFTMGQRPQLQQQAAVQGTPWYKADSPAVVLQGHAGGDGNAVYQVMPGQMQLQEQQQQQQVQQLQGGGRLTLGSLFQWR